MGLFFRFLICQVPIYSQNSSYKIISDYPVTWTKASPDRIECEFVRWLGLIECCTLKRDGGFAYDNPMNRDQYINCHNTRTKNAEDHAHSLCVDYTRSTHNSFDTVHIDAATKLKPSIKNTYMVHTVYTYNCIFGHWLIHVKIRTFRLYRTNKESLFANNNRQPEWNQLLYHLCTPPIYRLLN